MSLFQCGIREPFLCAEITEILSDLFFQQGARVLSVTPGNFETPMGNLEKDEAGTYLKFNAIKRNGRPEEIAALYEELTDERLSYLTGADIICDGGCIASGATAFAR